MSTPAVDGGIIENFVRSLYSGRFYRGAPFLRLRVGLKNLLLLGVVLGIVAATQTSTMISRGLVEWQEGVEVGAIPAIWLHEGRLQVKGPQPWIRPQADGSAIIIDTTGTYTTVPDSLPGGIFVGLDRAVYKSAPNVQRAYEFRGQSLPRWLDGPGLAAARRSLPPLAIVVAAPFLIAYYFLVNLLLVVPLAWLTVFIIRTLFMIKLIQQPLKFSYGQALTVALFVVTPVALLYKFIELVQPDLAGKLAVYYPALVASLLMAAVAGANAPPPVPPEPE